jgi:hypothetical protein
MLAFTSSCSKGEVVIWHNSFISLFATGKSFEYQLILGLAASNLFDFEPILYGEPDQESF